MSVQELWQRHQEFSGRIKAHKKLFIGAAIVVVLVGYYAYGKIFPTVVAPKYVVAQVKKDTLIVSVSGTGQVSATSQVDLKPKASGEVTQVNVKSGQEVKTGAVIAYLDARDALKSVRDAEASLASAKIAYAKLVAPADNLSVTQSENSLAQAEQTKATAIGALAKSYDDGFNTISSVFLDLPTVMAGVDDLLYKKTIDNSQINLNWYVNQTDYVKNERSVATNLRDDVTVAYDAARAVYNKSFSDYRGVSRSSADADLEATIDQTYDTVQKISDAIKKYNNYIDFVQDVMTQRGAAIPTAVTAQQTSVDSYTRTINTHLTSLASMRSSITTNKETILNADRTIKEKTESLAKLKAGADTLDIQSQKISLQQKENALLDAREKLSDYSIRAPFDGVIAKLSIKKGDTASSGTAAAVLITKQKIAELSFNEVDVARIKVGQKTTLTFDAVPDLTISGEVADMDTIGTATQGVVTYVVKIAFDTQDDRVKPSMSVSAAIVTDVKTDVLVVPSGAVKAQGQTKYVVVVDASESAAALAAGNSGIELSATRQQQVEIGLSNDTTMEIVSGLAENEAVVSRTIQVTTATTATPNGGGLKIPGMGGGGMGR